MTLADRARAVGIDPDDSKYHDRHPDHSGELCDWCHWHRSPRLRCDVQRAEANGKAPCSICREPRCEVRGLLCDECRDRWSYKGRRYRSSFSRAIRVDDGRGDVERLHPTEAAAMARDGQMDGFLR